MATFRVLTQCVMITGIKIMHKLLIFFLTHTHHQLLETIRVDLIGKERVEIYFCGSSIVQERRNKDNYTLLSLCVETFEKKRERERERRRRRE